MDTNDTRRNVAAFENEPDASATAIMLREQGYRCRVIVKGEESYDERMRDFFQGHPQPFAFHAYVVSEDAEMEPFARAVQHHFGQIVRGDVLP